MRSSLETLADLERVPTPTFSDDEGVAPEKERLTDNLDEIELESDGESDNDEEEGDRMQHIRDVGELEPDDSEDTVETELDASGSGEMYDATYIAPWKWTWDMSADQRIAACQALVNCDRELLALAVSIATEHWRSARLEYKRAESEARFAVFRDREVIATTITGCASRLEFLRSTQPFAVVVEEASEVQEQILFACLVPSICKLELVGDHLQLKPSLSKYFEFERINRLNVSLFERLISGNGSQVPSSILSVQRRMRSNVADFTRGFYEELTNIEDEARTGTQKLQVPAGTATDGREIPGIQPHIYLWSHSGGTERSAVGLSKQNTTEAKMILALVNYLHASGVRRESIAILTPYKGQVKLLQKELQAAQHFSHPQRSWQQPVGRYGQRIKPTAPSTVRISTVDMFQGDEEDIVLISLVIDGKQKTPFVRLQNRMIVLLSRARLGMYIVANAAYFENAGQSPHWTTTFNLLTAPGRDDSPVPVEAAYVGQRMGPNLPICCPRHRATSQAFATVAADLGKKFCSEICTELLPCGHTCGLRCHFPSASHNLNCSIPVDIDCQEHPSQIPCHVAVNQGTDCRRSVQVDLDCGHSITRPCHEAMPMRLGTTAFPTCQQPSKVPYERQPCKHRVSSASSNSTLFFGVSFCCPLRLTSPTGARNLCVYQALPR